MVQPMDPNPENRSAFQRQRAAYREEILDPLWRFVAAMREQPVITHSDAEATRQPPQEDRNPKRLPGEVKECNDCSDVEDCHKNSSQPIHPISIFRDVQSPLP
jgi:hypothetical protein